MSNRRTPIGLKYIASSYGRCDHTLEHEIRSTFEKYDTNTLVIKVEKDQKGDHNYIIYIRSEDFKEKERTDGSQEKIKGIFSKRAGII